MAIRMQQKIGVGDYILGWPRPCPFPTQEILALVYLGGGTDCPPRSGSCGRALEYL